MKDYKCIIFDCDGVLVDSEVLGNQAFIDLANRYGANLDINYAMEHFKGSHMKDCIRQVEEILGKSLPESFANDYRARSYEIFAKKLKPVKGVKRVLESLEIPFCTASSGPMKKIEQNLLTTGLYPFFNGNMFSCYDIEKWKPDPAIYLLAAKTMGFEIEDCLVVEDSMAGVMAAKNGDFDVYGFASHEKDPIREHCTRVFYEMGELLDLLHEAD